MDAGIFGTCLLDQDWRPWLLPWEIFQALLITPVVCLRVVQCLVQSSMNLSELPAESIRASSNARLLPIEAGLALPGQRLTVTQLELLPEHQVSTDETSSARRPQSSNEDPDRAGGSPLKLWLSEYQEWGIEN